MKAKRRRQNRDRAEKCVVFFAPCRGQDDGSFIPHRPEGRATNARIAAYRFAMELP